MASSCYWLLSYLIEGAGGTFWPEVMNEGETLFRQTSYMSCLPVFKNFSCYPRIKLVGFRWQF